ncbi:CPBP family intramembrane glutamic endopeptidase [Cognatitamlana onchidii]|uniref:CPBP family intramembrane glutamic endopeptidase n=1 Tax=Cognatitamlana onchidii TaxID=2562860 RepID=UPI0010A69A81|nr:CPBP family intramembrane glutamic endopeptidase [Algibacter onchidii]
MIATDAIWIIITLSFLTYFLVSWVYKGLGIPNLQQALLVRNGLQLLNLKHSLGIALFGVLFYVIIPELRVLIETIEIPRLYVLIPFIIIVFTSAYLSYLSIQNKVIKNHVISDCKISKSWFYFIIRFIFLLSYEFYFRGVLLYTFLECVSVKMAILYSTLAYFVMHVFDSKEEILGAIPFGVILCVITYLTNSVWYAFLIHLALLAVYEISIFYYLTLNKSIS